MTDQFKQYLDSLQECIVNSDNPRHLQHPKMKDNQKCSLMESMGKTVDSMRSMMQRFGMRPYRMYSITVNYENGIETLSSIIEITPTPKITFENLTTSLTSVGEKETGTIRVTEISPNYTEDEIKGLFSQKQHSFIEIQHDNRDGVTEKRRFRVADVPSRNVENFEWVVRLSIQQESRERSGKSSNSRLY